MIDKITLYQRALGDEYKGEQQFQTTVLCACRSVTELKFALSKPARQCVSLFSDLRSSIETYHDQVDQQMIINDLSGGDEQYYVDRRYDDGGDRRGSRGGFGQRGGRRSSRGGFRGGYFNGHTGQVGPPSRGYYGREYIRKKFCYVCKKEGCWSSNHTSEEQRRAKGAYIADCHFTGTSTKGFAAFLLDYKGHQSEANESDNENELFEPGMEDKWVSTT